MPSNEMLNKAKKRFLSGAGHAECRKNSDGTYSVHVDGYTHTGKTARHAWLYAGDIHIGAEDDEGLASG